MINKDKAIKYIIENFNWDKAHKVMKFLDWKWLGEDESPSHGKLMLHASKLLNDTYDKALENKGETVSIMTGGLKATAQRDEEGIYRLNLEFILTWWEYDFENEEIFNESNFGF